MGRNGFVPDQRTAQEPGEVVHQPGDATGWGGRIGTGVGVVTRAVVITSAGVGVGVDPGARDDPPEGVLERPRTVHHVDQRVVRDADDIRVRIAGGRANLC